jgi:hypothetical protein
MALYILRILIKLSINIKLADATEPFCLQESSVMNF